jgi:hypothetical protein
MKKAFDLKGNKYGHRLDTPFVLAYLDMHDFSTSLEEHLSSLYGPAVGGSPEACFISRGHPVNQRVSAAIVAWNLKPWSILQHIPMLFHNPWATVPLSVSLPWPEVRLEPADGSWSVTEGSTEFSELLGLPPQWPGPEKPFSRDVGPP